MQHASRYVKEVISLCCFMSQLIIFLNFLILIEITFSFILFFLLNTGLNPGVGGLPLKGWPLTVSLILHLVS